MYTRAAAGSSVALGLTILSSSVFCESTSFLMLVVACRCPQHVLMMWWQDEALRWTGAQLLAELSQWLKADAAMVVRPTAALAYTHQCSAQALEHSRS